MPPVDPAVEQYAAAHTTGRSDAAAAAAAWTAAERPDSLQMIAGLPEAQLLTTLVGLSGALNVLEIGTFTGVGTLALAAGLSPGGQVTTIELDPDCAAAARAHVDASPWADRVNLRVGDARQILETLPGPFDFVWLDAWKQDYPHYWAAVRPKLSPHGVLAADNVLLGGRVLDPEESDPATVGIRTFTEAVHADPDFDNVLLTVGDGVLLVRRR